MATTKKATNREETQPGYAEAIGEIERIVARFRNEQMDVDTLGAEVRRATELIAVCRERLRKAEEEVNKILEA